MVINPLNELTHHVQSTRPWRIHTNSEINIIGNRQRKPKFTLDFNIITIAALWKEVIDIIVLLFALQWVCISHLSFQRGLNASPPSAIVNDFTAESNSEMLCNIAVFNAHFVKWRERDVDALLNWFWNKINTESFLSWDQNLSFIFESEQPKRKKCPPAVVKYLYVNFLS